MISEIIVILLLVLLIPIGICIYKAKIKFKKTVVTLMTFIVIAITIVLSMFPIDILLKSFPTPEEAVSYQSKEDIGDVILKVHGEQSCVLKTLRNNSYTYLAKKDTDGWDYCTNASRQNLYKGFIGNKSIWVFQIKGTNDYYVHIFHSSNETSVISDNKNTKFESYIDENIAIYVGYINKLDENYKLMINGKKVDLR